MLPRKGETKIEPISLVTRNKVCVTNVVDDVICDACDPCNAMGFYLIHGNQHLQHPKTYKNQKLEKKMEGDTEDSRLKRQRNQLDKYKSLRKNVFKKVFKRRN